MEKTTNRIPRAVPVQRMGLARLLPVVACAALALGVSSASHSQEKVRWKLASSYGGSLDVLGENIKRLIENVEVMSDGNFQIKFYEPGALVPALEVFEAVSKGSVDVSYTTPGFHAGRFPHMQFFSSVPFGPNVNEYFAWLQEGGGREIYDEEYGKHNVKGFQCGIVVAESSGWFREEIKSLDQLRGLKMRFFGLGAKVMGKLGVSTQLLAGGDIYPALEKGVIDATEFSYPSLDKGLGLWQIAKHNYFPGWHQQASLLEVIVNKENFEALPKSYQKILEIACGEANMWIMAAAEARQGDAIEFHRSKGVTIHKWTDEQIEVFRKAWDEVLVEETAENPEFKRVYDSYKAFRDKYAAWKEVGYLK